MITHISRKVDGLERAFIPLFIANGVSWSLLWQIFTVLAVYSDEAAPDRSKQSQVDLLALGRSNYGQEQSWKGPD